MLPVCHSDINMNNKKEKIILMKKRKKERNGI